MIKIVLTVRLNGEQQLTLIPANGAEPITLDVHGVEWIGRGIAPSNPCLSIVIPGVTNFQVVREKI